MRVVIALDGSETAERIVERVGNWARSEVAEVTLLSVIHPNEAHVTAAPQGFTHSLTPAGTTSGALHGVAEPFRGLTEDRSQALTRAHSEREDYLRGVASRFLTGIDATFVIESSEQTAEAIVKAASRMNADFIAMATHGRKGMNRMLLGSVAEKVVRTAPMPVLLLGPSASS